MTPLNAAVSSARPHIELPPLRVAAVFVLAATLPTAVASKPAAEARVAVSANFREAAIQIGTAFQSADDESVLFSFGSTGQLYAQIAHGAPFDAFLAADSARAAKAIQEGLGVPGTQFTYAIGRIVLFSATSGLATSPDALKHSQFARLALAQPSTAPYGAAAMEALRRLGLFETVKDRIVTGLNVAQTYQFVQSGNADLGLVALSQVARHRQGSRWVVPKTMHSPIRQDAVLLERGSRNQVARAFLAFLRGREAAAILGEFGYGRPE